MLTTIIMKITTNTPFIASLNCPQRLSMTVTMTEGDGEWRERNREGWVGEIINSIGQVVCTINITESSLRRERETETETERQTDRQTQTDRQRGERESCLLYTSPSPRD